MGDDEGTMTFQRFMIHQDDETLEMLRALIDEDPLDVILMIESELKKRELEQAEPVATPPRMSWRRCWV